MVSKMFLKKLFNSITKATQPHFLFEDSSLKFLLQSREYFSYKVYNLSKKARFSSYVLDAYTLSNKDIFLESVTLNTNSTWAGQPRSIYEDFLKEELKIDSKVLLKRIDIGNYEFSIYKLDDSFIIHFIYIWFHDKNIFIVDSKGELFRELLKELKDDYVYKYDNEQKGEINFDISVVQSNTLKGHFESNGSEN
jgi:hypothetical protein